MPSAPAASRPPARDFRVTKHMITVLDGPRFVVQPVDAKTYHALYDHLNP
jgi:hypothetical protein